MSSIPTWIQLPDRSLLNFNCVTQIAYTRKSVESKGHRTFTVKSHIIDNNRKEYDFMSAIWDYARIHKDPNIFKKKNIEWCHAEALKRIAFTTQHIVKVNELARKIWELWVDKHVFKEVHQLGSKKKMTNEEEKGAVHGYYGESHE